MDNKIADLFGRITAIEMITGMLLSRSLPGNDSKAAGLEHLRSVLTDSGKAAVEHSGLADTDAEVAAAFTRAFTASMDNMFKLAASSYPVFRQTGNKAPGSDQKSD